MTKAELQELVTINEQDLQHECSTLPERFVHVYSLFSEADNAYSMHLEATTAMYATRYLAIRDDIIHNGGKPTDAIVDNSVKADKLYTEMLDKKYRLKQERDFLYGIIQGMTSKREMLKTLSFLRREDRSAF